MKRENAPERITRQCGGYHGQDSAGESREGRRVGMGRVGRGRRVTTRDGYVSLSTVWRAQSIFGIVSPCRTADCRSADQPPVFRAHLFGCLPLLAAVRPAAMSIIFRRRIDLRTRARGRTPSKAVGRPERNVNFLRRHFQLDAAQVYAQLLLSRKPTTGARDRPIKITTSVLFDSLPSRSNPRPVLEATERLLHNR